MKWKQLPKMSIPVFDKLYEDYFRTKRIRSFEDYMLSRLNELYKKGMLEIQEEPGECVIEIYPLKIEGLFKKENSIK